MKGPGKSYRKGLTIIELLEMFPDDRAAENWFEKQRWPEGPVCPECGSINHTHTTHKTMRYRCRDCRQFFSVRKGSVMEGSKIKLQHWAIAIYMATTGLKGVSSMKLSRDLGITQKSAWFMLQRIREAFDEGDKLLRGTVEVDETYMGGKRKNMSIAKRKTLKGRGRGATDKAVVVGMKCRDSKEVRAKTAEDATAYTLHKFIEENMDPRSTLVTDENVAYMMLYKYYHHLAVRHSTKEFVRGMAHTNGIESFWATLKRAYHGTFHHISKKHLNRYVQEFTGRFNIRELDTIRQMAFVAKSMEGKRLKYEELVN